MGETPTQRSAPGSVLCTQCHQPKVKGKRVAGPFNN